MNTRRFSRTMADAFGPYTDNVLHPMRDTEPFWSPIRIALALTYTAALIVLWVVW